MSSLIRRHARVALACFVVLLVSSAAHAQGFFGGEFERGTRPGAYVPKDGMSYSHWYNYDLGSSFYFGLDSQRLWQLDYLDRMDRAERFGYQRPMARPPLFNRLLGR